jgi:predicted RNA-binding protein
MTKYKIAIMKNDFEIKAHDGPGRLGKLRDIGTPNIIDEEEFPIAKDQGSAYSVQREIAEWCVEKTIAMAKESQDECKIAVIQGSKYVDLRIKCAKELEKLGYQGLIIANGDDLILHPRDLVDLIVNLRENIKASTYLIFPFAESAFIPLLSYMGIDGFLKGAGEYYSYLNVMMTPTKNYDLNIYELDSYELDRFDSYELENLSQDQLKHKNQRAITFVLAETRAHMKNGSLRNLVEERSATSPQNISALRILDKNHQDYLDKYTQLF